MNNINNLIALIILSCLASYSTFASDKTLAGTLVVVNKSDDTVSFIDVTSRKIKTTVDTGKGAHELAISRSGKWAVVTNYIGGNSLSIYDVQQAKKIRTIDLSAYPRPHGVLFLKDDRQVAVSSEGSDSVIIVDIHSGFIEKVLATEQSGSHMVAMPLSAELVYTSNMGSNTVSEINISSGKLLRQIPTPNIPEAITVNKAGTELWVGSNKEGLVTVFDLKTGAQIKQWQDFSFPYRILLTDDERYVVIPDYKDNKLTVIDLTSDTQLHHIDFGWRTIPNGVVFHPDDRTLFMSAYGKDKVLVIDIVSGEVLFELPTGDGPDGIGFSSLTLK